MGYYRYVGGYDFDLDAAVFCCSEDGMVHQLKQQ